MQPETISAISNVAVAIFAGPGLAFAIRQISISRELAALATYEQFHLTSLQHPIYSSGQFDFHNCTLIERCNYETFVLYTLMIGEQIYVLFPNDPGWRYSIEDDIRQHREYLASDYFAEHRQKQGWLTKAVIEKVLAETAAGS